MNLVDRIAAYESGEMDQDEIVELFQDLVDRGLAWKLQGSYGRMAAQLADEGLIDLHRADITAAQSAVEDLS